MMQPEGRADAARWLRRQKAGPLLWVFGTLAAVALVLSAARLVRSTPEAYQSGDVALLEIDVLHSINGLRHFDGLDNLWALGPYSRFGWHHPGPLFFYLLAPLYVASGCNTLGLPLGALFINVTALGIICWVARRFLDPWPRSALLLVFGAFVWEIRPALTSPWNPHVTLLPAAAALVVAAAVGAGSVAWLPLLIIGTSFLAQTNVSTVPLSITAVAAALVLYCRHETDRRGQPWVAVLRSALPWAGWSAAAGLLLWLLPLADHLQNDPGNFRRLQAFFASASATAGQPPALAWSAWVDPLTAFLRNRAVVPWGFRFVPTTGWASTMLAAGLITLLAAAISRRDRLQSPFLHSLAAVTLAGAVAAHWAPTRIVGDITDYSVFWIAVIGAVAVSALASIGSQALAAVHGKAAAGRRLTFGANALVMVLLVAAVAVGGYDLRDLQRQARRRTGEAATVRVLTGGLQEYALRQKIRRPLYRMADPASWSVAAGVVLHFYRTDRSFAVSNDLQRLVGARLTPTGAEDATFDLATPGSHATLAARRGDVEVVQADAYCVHTLERR